MCEKAAWTLFLDRDGVINERMPDAYIYDFNDFKFKKDFLDVFPKIASGFKHIFIVTNQQGIGKGLMTIEELEVVHNKMLDALGTLAKKINRIYFCPHLKDENCQCRKPNPGMAYMAKNDFPAIDLKKAILIGDRESDVEFGKNAGMKTILINTDNEETSADYSVKDFYEIENIIKRLLK
ncbi:MAG: HAD-IIIA family hydrolase [Spirochaetes bacterium]|nr:HAD-IIIA family hydrolase [Spirochaetota bacterium]